MIGLVFVGLAAAEMTSAFNRIAALEGAARPADLADGVSSALRWSWWYGAPAALAGIGLVVIGLIVGSPERRSLLRPVLSCRSPSAVQGSNIPLGRSATSA